MSELVILTTTQVAEIFSVDASTVRRWVDKGVLIPAHSTPGGHHRFRRGDVEALLQPSPTAGQASTSAVSA